MTEALLEARLIAAGPRLTVYVLGEMYEDPFWAERFGDRGRVHAGRDGGFHIQYLVEALAAREAALFETYARWLREVLVSRGMCSRHLADNFHRLAAAIDRESWPDRQRAIDVLHAGARALAHVEGDPGRLDRARVRLATEVAASIPGVSMADVEHHLSFLADAVALGRPELFSAYVTFLVGSATRRGRSLAPLGATLDRLAAALPDLGVAPDVGAVLAAARAAVPS